jgi:hypothetical protein
LIGGGGIGGGGAGGGSSYSIGSNTVYTTGYQIGDGSITIEFYTNPTFKFSCTKSMQNLTVPLGYNYMYVDMSGAASGGGGIGTPGFGARIQSSFTVVPGTVLHVTVGCQGMSCPASTLQSSTYLAGGYNGGGAGFGGSGNFGGTGGGGASDIRIAGMSLTDRMMVAGGGGGYFCPSGCGAPKGGDGGKIGLDGSAATSGSCSGYGQRAAGGGNWTSGGAAGGFTGAPNPTRGSLGFGGSGGFSNSGGGGGGYYGGNRCYSCQFIHRVTLIRRWRRC